MSKVKFAMQFIRYASTLVFTLALLSPSAYAAVVIQIDIAKPNAITFISTGANSHIFDNSYDECLDGLSLLDVLATDAPNDVGVAISGGFTPWGSGTVLSSVTNDNIYATKNDKNSRSNERILGEDK